MNIQAKVALDKQKHPEKFCPVSGCLWRLFSVNYPGGYKPCQKHGHAISSFLKGVGKP